MLDAIIRDALPLVITNFQEWLAINRMVEEIRTYNDYYNITFCSYTFELDGVLKDQASYYLGSEDQIVGGISDAATAIVDELTLASNFTLSAPLSR